MSVEPLRTPPGLRTPGALTLALASLSEVQFRLGDWEAAYLSAVAALRLAQSSGRGEEIAQVTAQLALVEAGLGREETCRTHADQALMMVGGAASESCTRVARAAVGLLELGLSRPDAAVAQLEPLSRSPIRACEAWATDLAEALIRRDDREQAGEILDSLSHAESFSTRCAVERCRGLLAADDRFELHFARALGGCSHLQEPFERARTELCFGERLRRIGRRLEAREHLAAALATFDRLGAAPWAEKARHELGAGAPSDAHGER
jgi:hypothetical protein